MSQPLQPPLAPQLSKSAGALPTGPQWRYEPKLDGFRAIVFVRDGELTILSRSGRPLGRYFPELRFPDVPCVLDGEIIIGETEGHQDFEALQTRLHPAASRVERLSREIPATFVAFDLLEVDGASVLELPFTDRRARLEALLGAAPMTPVTDDPDAAQVWLTTAEGVIAKDATAPYRPGERLGMVKIKRVRTIDAVILGWRPGKDEGTVGSLILGAYEPDGTLRGIGHSSGFTAKQKRELVAMLAPYETGERGTGDASRWSGDRDLSWVSLRPELVAEVSFDHVSGGRIRHGAKTLRFRDDKAPGECGVDQLDS
ncbi:MAG TPA: ATP-dependent DNA ligase [Miltoncostaeales bacterium]|nr:ATP-dependent DNA ligase [Miltoncostaeales bacterium]